MMTTCWCWWQLWDWKIGHRGLCVLCWWAGDRFWIVPRERTKIDLKSIFKIFQGRCWVCCGGWWALIFDVMSTVGGGDQGWSVADDVKQHTWTTPPIITQDLSVIYIYIASIFSILLPLSMGLFQDTIIYWGMSSGYDRGDSWTLVQPLNHCILAKPS